LVKAWLELGIVGAVLVLWVLIAVLRAVLREAAQSRRSRALSAGVAGFVVATVLISVKGAVLDQAPANAYFWLFVGLALGSATWSPRSRPNDASGNENE
jgi:O-antigen ligase